MRETEQLQAEMKARVDAILADPELDENVFCLILKAGVEVAGSTYQEDDR